MVADTSAKKEKIIFTIKRRGPCLPIHISKEIDTNMLFASAFLSELVSEKRIIISNMKVGSSPLYLLEEQKPLLEKFAHHLKSKEKEAYNLLKEKRILKDREQEPAIRVALRAIKDFAIPFQKENDIYWRYFLVNPEENLFEDKKEEKVEELNNKDSKEQIKEKASNNEIEGDKITNIEKKEIKPKKKSAAKKKGTRTNKKQEEKFLEKVKEFLSKSSVAIINIESIGKGELTLRIKINDKEQLLVGYNKKRIDEKDIIKASKKARELGLKYSILCLGDLPKKVSDLIEALKNIEDIEKLE